MSSERINLSSEELEKVVGGFFHFNTNTMTMKYTHEDGTVTYHKILNAEKAWEMSNQMHAKRIPEDDILKELIDNKYIAG